MAIRKVEEEPETVEMPHAIAEGALWITERHQSAVRELTARWHRAEDKDDAFTQGRREGYTQAVQLLLDLPHSEVVLALRGGKI